MFIGRYYHTLEGHGRLSLPKAFRDQATNWVVTRGLDGGLFVFKQDQFREKLRELTERTFTQKSNRDFIRLMTNDAVDVETDSNGRVQLPEYLIEFGKLTKRVIVVGSFDWIEIWDADLYHTYLSQLEPQAEQIAEGLIT
jgi:MraZ protein